jgi:hypothetical protein
VLDELFHLVPRGPAARQKEDDEDRKEQRKRRRAGRNADGDPGSGLFEEEYPQDLSPVVGRSNGRQFGQ